MGADAVLEVLAQTATSVQPAEGPLHDPPLRQEDETFGGIAALDDLQRCSGHPSHRSGRLDTLIAAVRHDFLEKRKQPADLLQDRQAAVAILDVGGQNIDAEHQAETVDDGMPLAAFDFLARVIADRVRRLPPLSAPFTLWLSMMASVGLASLPAISRAFS